VKAERHIGTVILFVRLFPAITIMRQYCWTSQSSQCLIVIVCSELKEMRR